MSTEQSIREFVERFYAALNCTLNGNAAPMLALWSRGPEVTVMHPDGARQMGAEEVRGAFEAWAANVARGRIAPRDVSIRLVTSDVAVVCAVETGEGTIGPETVQVDSRATLVVRRDGAGWTAVHHHVDVNPRIRALVEAAQTTVDVADARLGSPEPALS